MRILSSIPVCDANQAEKPVAVFFEPLHGCNFWCRYCYIGASANHKQAVIPTFDTLLPVLEKIAAVTNEVILLGGEPTLHPGFLNILRYFRENGVESVGLLTNGTRMSAKMAAEVKALGCWANVSLRGASAETFDYLANKPGAFDIAQRALRALADAGVETGIEYDCLPHNYEQLLPTIEALVDGEGLTITQIQLHRVYVDEQDSDKMAYHLSLPQWNKVFDQAQVIADRYGILVMLEDELPLCNIKPEHHPFIVNCSCESNILVVDPQGRARRYFFSEAQLGDLYKDDPESLLLRAQAARRQAPKSPPEPCASCGKVESCLGNWMASAGERLNRPWVGYQSDLIPEPASRLESVPA